MATYKRCLGRGQGRRNIRQWSDPIRDGTDSLTVDTIPDASINDSLELAISYLDGYFASSITQVISGGVIWFTQTSEWRVADVNYDATGYTISNAEIEYRSGATLEGGAMLFSHELLHVIFGGLHTNVDVFITDSSPSVDEPHYLETLTAYVGNVIGSESPYGDQIDIYHGFGE